MARLATIGFETQTQSATLNYHGESDLSTAPTKAVILVGTPTISTTTPRSGAACLRCDASADYTRVSGGGVFGTLDRTYFARAALRVADETPAATVHLMRIELPLATQAGRVQLTTTGTLQLVDNAGTVIGTSSAISPNVWYVIEMEIMVPTAGAGTLGFRVDGVEIARSTSADVNNVVTTPVFNVGYVAGAGGTFNIDVDDIAINDDQGGAQDGYPGLGKVILLKPTADSALGTGWEAPQTTGSDTTNIYTAVDNIPPVGVAHSDADAANQAYVFNIANLGSASNYDVTCQTYTAGGVASADTVVLTQALIRASCNSLTGTNTMAMRSVSNPADGADTTALNVEATAVAGTEPTGWKSFRTAPQYAPSVTKGTAPVVRAIRNMTGITRAHMVDLMGLLVEYLEVTSAPEDVPLGTAAAQSNATLALTAKATVTLGQADALSAATFVVDTPQLVPLATSPAQSAATLTVRAFGPYADEVWSDGPYYWWRLGEATGTFAEDQGAVGAAFGLPQNGTYVNTPTLGVAGPLVGDDATGATFTAASSERVETGTLGTFGSAMGVSSWEFWYKGTTTGQGFILGQSNTGTATSVAIETNSNATGGASVGSTRFLMTSTAPADNRCHITHSIYDGNWHHVVAVTNATVGWVVYVDGVSRTTSSQSGTPGTYNNFNIPLDIGAFNWGGVGHVTHLEGSLDEVAIYGGRLSATQVLDHYNAAIGSAPVDVVLGAAAAQSAATLALKSSTQVPLQSSPALSNATLSLSATTRVPLETAVALSNATLTLRAQTQVPLGTAAAQSTATLALTGAATVPLGTSASLSAATLTLKAQTTVPLATAASLSTATLALTGKTTVALGTSPAASNATLALRATTTVPLNAAAATSTASLALTAQAEVPLGSAVALSSATLDLSIAAGEEQVPLDPAAATSSATLTLRAQTQVPLQTSDALSSATLALTAQTTVALETAASLTTATLTLTATTRVALGTSPAQSNATLTLTAQARIPLDTAAALSGATLALRAQTQVPLGTAAAQSAATLALRATTTVPLGTAASLSTATLALTSVGVATVPLGTSAALSSATLTLKASTQVPLATSSAQSAATLTLRAQTTIPLNGSAAQSAATLAVTTPTPAIVFQSSAAQSSASLALRATTYIVLGGLQPATDLYPDTDLYPGGVGAQGQSSASLVLITPSGLFLYTSAAQSNAALAVGIKVTIPLGAAAAQSVATAVLGIYYPPPETNPELGGVIDEAARSALIDEGLTGAQPDEDNRNGAVVPVALGAALVGDRGGIYDESVRGATVLRIVGGTFDEGLTGGIVEEGVIGGQPEEDALGGPFDEGITGADDDVDQGADPDQDNRGGVPDLVLTGGDVL